MKKLDLHSQAGQVLPLFALMAVFLVGVVALAVDIGSIENQHRNIQAYADSAANAGVQNLSPNNNLNGNASALQAAARKAAIIYLKDNITNGNGASKLPLSSFTSPCWGSPGFASDIENCAFPAPYSNYIISICTPGEAIGSGSACATQNTQVFSSISVRIQETVSTALAGIIGNPSALIGGFSSVQYSSSNITGSSLTPSSKFPFALYSNGCLDVTAGRVSLQGETYINQCSLTASTGNRFCDITTPFTAGNLLLGPDTTPPPAFIQNQAGDPCSGAGGSTSLLTTGEVITSPSYIQLPSFTPPPGFSDFDPNTGATAPAVGGHPCFNGSKTSTGANPNNCFNPGYYTTISGIANNLNPGVYYITGAPVCDNSNSTFCPGVTFSGNTLNANYQDVQNSCWGGTNSPSADTFTSPCPNGFINDPTANTIVDPQCPSGSCLTGFNNIPASDGASNGVTFVLFDKASFCLNINCQAGGSAISVMLSPFCSTLRSGLPASSVVPPPVGITIPTRCSTPYSTSGYYSNDGAFVIYSSSAGTISSIGTGFSLDLNGTIYAPAASLAITASSQFELVPGQAIVRNATFQITNSLIPFIYWPCCSSNGQNPGNLEGAQQTSNSKLAK
jgi:hypothetical protein